MQTLSPDDYHLALAYYMIAAQAQSEVRRYEKLIGTIIKDKSLNEKLNDSIYDPRSNGGKTEFTELLLDSNVIIEWKLPQNKIFKGDEEDKEMNLE